ncbi:MAG: hypothetical protein IKT00_09930 [Prevotella sp.]|nr:hypothetical protein [Prevotella sp.]
MKKRAYISPAMKTVYPQSQLLDGNTEVCWSEVNDGDIKTDQGVWNDEEMDEGELFINVIQSIWDE